MTNATISFVTSTGGAKIIIAADSERNTDSAGREKTSFTYGETAYFRIYAENPDRLAVFATDGSLTSHGIFTEEVADENVSFIEESAAPSGKPVLTLNSFAWLGRELGAITRRSPYSVTCSETPKPSEGKIGTALISYRTAYALFGLKLTAKNRDTYPVLVYAEALNG